MLLKNNFVKDYVYFVNICIDANINIDKCLRSRFGLNVYMGKIALISRRTCTVKNIVAKSRAVDSL